MNFFMITTYATAVNEETEAATSGIKSIAEMISEYGPLIVLLSIFFLVFIALIAIVLKSNNKMMRQIMNRNNLNGNLESEIINKFVDGALKELTTHDEVKNTVKDAVREIHETEKREKDKYHSDLIASYIGTNVIFKDASRSAMRDLKCDRIGVYVFHNGNTSSLGLPFFKTSCVHDWTSIGASTMRGKTHVDVPLNAFDDIVEALWTNGVYKSENVHQTANSDQAIDNFIAGSRTEAMYAMVIKDDNSGAITGFVVAEFDKIDDFEHNEARDTEIKTVLNNMIMKISTTVNNKVNTHNDK